MPVTKTEVQGKKGKFTWIDVTAPTPEEIAALGAEFGFHHLALEDCTNNIQRPKIEDYGEYSFIIAKHLKYTQKIEKRQIAFFVGKEFIVTAHKEEFLFLEDIRKTKLAPEAYKISETPDFILYLVLDRMVNNYFDIVDKLSDEIDKIEKTVLTNPTRKTLEHMMKTRRELVRVRRHVWPLREVLHSMQAGVMPGMTKNMNFYFRDLYDHVIRIIDLTETERELLSGVLETYLSWLSNSINQTVKVLTVLASFVLVPTLISGIYGMNFEYMPEIKWRLGYPFSLLLMLASIVLMWVYFRRKQWI